MANTHTTLASLFSDIADAIRAKTGETGTLVADNFPTAIEAIKAGGFPNGTEWTQSNVTKDCQCVHYADGIWVAGFDTAPLIRYSTDGKTWTQGSGIPGMCRNVYKGNDIWVACTNGLCYSTDGKTWTQSNIDTSKYILKAHYANGIWVCGGNANSGGFYYSTDGKTWTQSNITSGYCKCIFYANGIWVIGGSNVNGLLYSTDGKTWTQSNVTNVTIEHVYNSNGVWVVCSFAGLYYSTDGKTWTQSNITTKTFKQSYNANGIWVACGDALGLYYSVTWEAEVPLIGFFINNATSDYGVSVIIHCPDGYTWEDIATTYPNEFDIVYTGSMNIVRYNHPVAGFVRITSVSDVTETIVANSVHELLLV